MKRTSVRAKSAPGQAKRHRRNRPRPTPKWLREPRNEVDEMARRRLLMVLTVLSGAQPVSDAITEAQISRGTYYKLESQALGAMLAALRPGAEASSPSTGSEARVADLEAKVKRLEQDKRRTERLLFLTRQVVKPGPLTSGAGRPRGRSSSTPAGRSASRGSKSEKKTAPSAPSPSTPRPDGAAGPSSGSAS